jgi:DNA-binding transcriptional LysR family regulator
VRVQPFRSIIPPVWQNFIRVQRGKNISNDNTEQIEKALAAREIDLGVVEGQSKVRRYSTFRFLQDDELVLFAVQLQVPSQEITMDQLVQLPFVTRE